MSSLLENPPATSAAFWSILSAFSSLSAADISSKCVPTIRTRDFGARMAMLFNQGIISSTPSTPCNKLKRTRYRALSDKKHW